MENSILNYLTNETEKYLTSFDHVRIPIYSSNVPSKMFYGSIGVDFFRIFTATSNVEDLSSTHKQLLSRMLKQNEPMKRIKFSLIKMIQ